MTRTNHKSLLESLGTKELVLTNEEFDALRKRISDFNSDGYEQ